MTAIHTHQRSVEFRRGLARYEPQSRIAAGGMAEVWRGQALFEDGHAEPVAIKRVLPDLARKPLYRSMFEDEARIGMLLRHPNIVRVFDAREVRGTFIMIMELVEGPSLRAVLGRAQQRKACMPAPVALFIARELAGALEFAHASLDDFGRPLNMIHRDVSPQNMLLGSDGVVKLMDFGLANASANHTDRDPTMVGGKLGYLSPELVSRREASASIDIFALGVVLWEALTGRRLFKGKDDADTVRQVARCQVPPASSFNPGVSPPVEKVLERALAADPVHRYGSAGEFASELGILLQRLDAEVGAGDVALMVRMYRRAEEVAQKRAQARADGSAPQRRRSEVAEQLAQELAAFVAASPTGSRDSVPPASFPVRRGQDDSVLDDSVLDDSALDDSALDGSALDGSALDGSALDGSALDGSASEGSALDGSVSEGGGSGAPPALHAEGEEPAPAAVGPASARAFGGGRPSGD